MGGLELDIEAIKAITALIGVSGGVFLGWLRHKRRATLEEAAIEGKVVIEGTTTTITPTRLIEEDRAISPRALLRPASEPPMKRLLERALKRKKPGTKSSNEAKDEEPEDGQAA